MTTAIEDKIQRDILDPVVRHDYAAAKRQIALVLAELYANIPAGKRISYGRVHTVKVLAAYLHARLAAAGAPVVDIAASLYEADQDPRGLIAAHDCRRAQEALLSRQRSARLPRAFAHQAAALE